MDLQGDELLTKLRMEKRKERKRKKCLHSLKKYDILFFSFIKIYI